MRKELSKTESYENKAEKVIVVSIGRHTRLGDVLEFAIGDTAFVTIDADDFSRENWADQRLLFAVSADAAGENTQLHSLFTKLHKDRCSLEGCICAAILDGAQGTTAHLDALKLLLAANQAGASVLSRPMIESDKELRFFMSGKEPPFERYRAQARALTERLISADMSVPEHSRVRFSTALEGGIAHDWRELLSRMIAERGGGLEDIGETDETILLCENTDGLPGEKTLSLLNAKGALRLLLASPSTGSDLYTFAVMERACLRGNYALPPRAVIAFEGMSAVEALASKREVERLKNAMTKRCETYDKPE